MKIGIYKDNLLPIESARPRALSPDHKKWGAKLSFRLLLCGRSAIISRVSRKIYLFGMCMIDEIRAKRDEIYAIARAYKAEKLWVFGGARTQSCVFGFSGKRSNLQ